MTSIYDIISRARKLREETRLDSISPDRIGALHEDTLKYINEYQLLASSPAIHKTYASVSDMQSDPAPESDLTGNALKVGQLVVIVPADQTDSTAGDVYRYDGPSGNTSAWSFISKIGAVQADSALSSTSTNPLQNKVVTEKLTELESKKEDLTDTMVNGGFVLIGKLGYSLSISILDDGNFRRVKIPVNVGERYRLTGVGGGKEYISSVQVTEDLTSSVANGYYTYSSTNVGEATTATRNYDGSWRCIAQPVKAGDMITLTGTGGAGARLYCLVNSSNVIKAIAGSDETQAGLVINVEEDGTLYCSFNYSLTYSLIREYTETTESNEAGARLYCLTDSNDIIIGIADVGANVKDYDIDIAFNGYLYINFSALYGYSVTRLIERFVKMESDIATNTQTAIKAQYEAHEALNGVKQINQLLNKQFVTEDLTSSVANGYYTYSSTNVGEATTATRNYDGSWRCIAQPVKAGDMITLTGTGGAGARLYCLVNSSNVIKAIAGSDETQAGLVINVEEDGTLYCSFNPSYTFAITREYAVIGIAGTTDMKNGSCSFGKTCDMDFTAPNITPYSFPNTGKVAAIYGYYDALVAKYPAYVTKIDCDAAMSLLGIAKPAAIADLPMYMYRFAPPKAPNSTAFGATESSANMIKALILTGTHNEYIAIWDCYNAMRLICEDWQNDRNLEELRWNSEIYIIPCYNLYGVENSTRTNENGVDLNRNAPTSGWQVQGALGDNTYSGESAGSEYSTRVMLHYFGELNPQIFIDHHNTNVGAGTSVGDGKNMIYVHSLNQICIDFTSVLISQMTRKWKLRYTDTFPSIEDDPTTLYGYVLTDNIAGSIGRYGSENGALGSTYESNFGILYKNGEFSTDNRQLNTELVTTCAVEGFVNYLLRSFGAYSDYVGVNKLL